MDRLLPKIFLDFNSFLAGAIIIAALFILYFVFRKRIKSILGRASSGFIDFRNSLSISSDSDYIKIVYRYAQSLHVAADYFSLESILVPSRCIAPPPAIEPEVKALDSSLIQQSLGYDPALPELISEFFGPHFTLQEALSGNTNICLIGFPGSGKTTAIAECMISLVKGGDPDHENPAKIPFYTKAHHILAQFPGSDIPEILLSAIQANKIFQTAPNFARYFTSVLNAGTAILFIDDIDLLTYTDTNRIANFINALCQNYPNLQVVVTASPSCLGNLVKAPLSFVSIKPWGNAEKYHFLEKLSRQFPLSVADQQDAGADRLSIRNSMLVVSDRFLTPLDFTLKSLAAYAGDISGPTSLQAVESFLKRSLASISKDALRTLEAIALHSLEQHKSSFSRKDISIWLSSIQGDDSHELSNGKIAPLSPVIQAALDSNILQKSSQDEFFFNYPTFGGYLAARALTRSGSDSVSKILDQPDWSLMHETMRFFSAFNDIQPYLNIIQADKTLLKDKFIRASLWLINIETNSSAELNLLKLLTREIQANSNYMIKIRLVTALSKSLNKDIKGIFQHLLKSTDIDTRRAAAIGSGLIQDLSAVPFLIQQLNDPFPSSTSACYSLGRIGSPRSLEAIAEGLLHGNELLRRASAESLAQNRSEGHPALREGILMDDLLVRYAVVHGLSLIPEDWAIEIIDKMRIDEGEWVVRDLAQQIFEMHESGSPYIPKHLPPPHLTAWLDKFALKHGLSKPNPENALDSLLIVLESGTAEEKQAALAYIGRSGDPDMIPHILDHINSTDPDLKQLAALGILYCAPPGYTSKPPIRS
jgi:HEAT repeat protein